ncbi:hypothetical protein ACIRJR_13315 [Streptomyces sp. NPDC102402]|uniref:hypothetical protein n=1 Tax=Streptomyces sp. NPDC102402 TaxID=3366169 RepID=UPI00380413E0
MLSQRYDTYDFSGLPDGTALVLGILSILMMVVLFGGLLWIGPRRKKDPEARERAAAGKASRNRQARLRKRRTALQKKAARRAP